MQTVFMVGDEPVPGYKLLEKLGGSAFYRLWRVQAPDQSTKLWKEIDLVVGNAAVETRTLGLLVQLRHAYLNTLTNFWQLDDGNTLVIETDIPLMTLRERLTQAGSDPIPASDIHEFITQAAEGLDFLNSPIHEFQGQKVAIYHRALTLDSLLLFQEGGRAVCKVSDFGLAKPVTEQNAAHSQGLQNYDYDPPEFFEGQTAPTSDQYSLAVNYYELRTNSQPFAGSMLEQLQAKLSDRPNLSALQEPERSIVRKALASNPGDRYSSCSEFAEALRANAASAGAVAASSRPASSAPSIASPALAATPPAATVPVANVPMTPSSTEAAATLDAAPAPKAGNEIPGVVFRPPPAEMEQRPNEQPTPPSPQPRNAQDVVAALRAGRQAAPSKAPTASTAGDDFAFSGDDGEKKIPIYYVLVILLATALLVFYVASFLMPAANP